MQVNRYLKDKAVDRIDHALGRPVDPMGSTDREYYATDRPDLDGLIGNPHWRLNTRQGCMQYFVVTNLGRAALRDYLRSVGERTRFYSVRFDDLDLSSVAATSHGAARYQAYLNLDSSDLTFGDFCRHSRVRLA